MGLFLWRTKATGKETLIILLPCLIEHENPSASCYPPSCVFPLWLVELRKYQISYFYYAKQVLLKCLEDTDMGVIPSYDHNLWTHFTRFFPSVLLLVTSEHHSRGFMKKHPGRGSSKENKEINPESISIIFSLLNSTIGKCSGGFFNPGPSLNGSIQRPADSLAWGKNDAWKVEKINNY